jgi:hydrogenase maturation factor
VLAALADEGIAAADIGEALKGNGVVWLTATDGTVAKLTEPVPDGYWAAYDRAVREGWT